MNNLWKRIKSLFKKEKPVQNQQPTWFHDPLYPPDLAELFSANRTETHTDTCLWKKVPTKDK